jgi:hypothetical protein
MRNTALPHVFRFPRSFSPCGKDSSPLRKRFSIFRVEPSKSRLVDRLTRRPCQIQLGGRGLLVSAAEERPTLSVYFRPRCECMRPICSDAFSYYSRVAGMPLTACTYPMHAGYTYILEQYEVHRNLEQHCKLSNSSARKVTTYLFDASSSEPYNHRSTIPGYTLQAGKDHTDRIVDDIHSLATSKLFYFCGPILIRVINGIICST